MHRINGVSFWSGLLSSVQAGKNIVNSLLFENMFLAYTKGWLNNVLIVKLPAQFYFGVTVFGFESTSL